MAMQTPNAQALFGTLESRYGLPQGLLDSVWSAESSRGRNMTSSAGAQGHFQFMPGTAKQYGVADPNNLVQSATGAARMYSDLLKQTGGNLPAALAAYNWGIGNVQRKGLGNMPDETRNYIQKVTQGMGQAAGDAWDTTKRYAENVLGWATGSTPARAGELTQAQRAYANAAWGPSPPPGAQAQGYGPQPQPQQQGDPWAAFREQMTGGQGGQQQPQNGTGNAGNAGNGTGNAAPASGASGADAADPWAAFRQQMTGGQKPASGAQAPNAQSIMDEVRARYSTNPQQAPQNAPQTAGAAQPAQMPTAASQAATGQQEQPQPQRGFFGNVGHQLGLTGRAAAQGVASVAGLVGDPLNALVNQGIKGINAATGASIPTLGTIGGSTGQLLDTAGVAKPENATERVVQDASTALASAATGNAAGGLLGALSPAGSITSNIGQFLGAKAGTQAASAIGAGLGSGTARETNLGETYGETGKTVAQMGAGLLGGLAGAGVAGLANYGINRFNDAQQAAAIARNPVQQEAITQTRKQSAIQRVTRGGDMNPTAAQALTPEPQPGDAQRMAQQAANNPNVDAASLQRQQDFRDLGIPPTTGQLSRDPIQYAKEQNMRAQQPGLAQRFNTQDKQLAGALDSMSPVPSLDRYAAGTGTKQALQNIDNTLGREVTDAYTAARASTGAKLDVPLDGLAQDYARVIDEFGTAVPSGVKNQFEKLGLLSGTQRQTFDMEDAERLLKVINKNVGSDRAANTALSELRNSVKDAVLSADDKGGAFADARRLAAQRFQLYDAIPALKDAATDATSADNFINRHVIGASTDDVTNLAGLLRERAPEQFQQLKSQMVSSLQKAGFGAGEQFNPGAYAKQMNAFGPTKLSAFFSPDELEQLKTIGRVGSYMRTIPSASPVNFSNSATTLLGSLADNGLIGKIPWAGKAIGAAADRAFANSALSGQFQHMAPAALSGPVAAPGLLGLLSATRAGANAAPGQTYYMPGP